MTAQEMMMIQNISRRYHSVVQDLEESEKMVRNQQQEIAALRRKIAALSEGFEILHALQDRGSEFGL